MKEAVLGNDSSTPGDLTHDPRCDPTGEAAERLRSILLAAHSLALQTAGHAAQLAGRHTVTASGQVQVELPADSCMASHLSSAGETVATIEVTDVAPTAVRDRVRARAELTGWLRPIGGANGQDLVATLDLTEAALVTDRHRTTVDPAAFAAAQPDPLAAAEASLLCHLADRHPQTVRALCRLVPHEHLHGVRAVHPFRLDRHGVMLRLQYATNHIDVRLHFPTPLRQPRQLAAQIDALLEATNPSHARFGTG